MIEESFKPIHAAQWAADRSLVRIRQLVDDGYTYGAMALVLGQEGYQTIQGKPWTAVNLRQLVFRLRARASTWYAQSAQWARFVPHPLQ